MVTVLFFIILSGAGEVFTFRPRQTHKVQNARAEGFMAEYRLFAAKPNNSS
jgi:hypothetical protein